MSTVLSPNKHTGRKVPIRLIVIHTTESGEISAGAENNAAWFAKPASRASAHIVVDANTEVRCVPDKDTAWAAPGANADGLQLEIVGRAGQGTAGWADDYSRAALERAAHLVAAWCREHNISVRRLSVDQVRDGKTRGIAGHVDVSAAFKRSTHWDPGPTFPWTTFLARIAELTGTTPPAPAPTPTPAPSPGAGQGALAVDGLLGPATIRQWQRQMGTPVDGVISPVSTLIKAVQRHLIDRKISVGPAGADGRFGPATIRAVQQWLGTPIDGKISRPSEMVKALQRTLNNGKF